MNHTQKFIQDRKLYLAFPLLTTPFLIMIFWALGGGTQAATPSAAESKGLITSVPDPRIDESDLWDKLNLYEKAKADSMRYEEARENDPYFDLAAFKTSKPQTAGETDNKLINAFPSRQREVVQPIEQTIQAKLNQLSATIASSERSIHHENETSDAYSTKTIEEASDKEASTYAPMEEMMELIGKKNQEPDPQMQQIDGVLEKILDIQHPERVQQRMNAEKVLSRANTFPVSSTPDRDVTLLSLPDADSVVQVIDSADLRMEPNASSYQNSFYGLSDDSPFANTASALQGKAALNAVIHDTQELVTGSTVKLRLTEPVTIAGIALPKGQFIHGTCEINAERLQIKITSIRFENILLPVTLSAYDLDGLEGIYIPGAISRDAAKQGSSNALQSMQLMNVNPSIGAQAASAGIEAAKGLMSKKVRLVKVTVKAGYQLLLQDANTAFN